MDSVTVLSGEYQKKQNVNGLDAPKAGRLYSLKETKRTGHSRLDDAAYFRRSKRTMIFVIY